jgi:hypothetical protein
MTQGTFSFGKMLVVAVAGLLLGVSQTQAAPPMGTGSSTAGTQTHGGFPMMPGSFHRHGFGFRWWPGVGFYSYPYFGYSYDPYYVNTGIREQQYQYALLYQEQQYNQALRQVRSAAYQQGRAAQQGYEPTSTEPAPAKVTTRPASTPVREVVSTPEDRAAGKLKMAKALAQNGQAADAADYFREIVQKYPGTIAAREAQESLDKGNLQR